MPTSHNRSSTGVPMLLCCTDAMARQGAAAPSALDMNESADSCRSAHFDQVSGASQQGSREGTVRA
jgi:hypothetical protein